MNSIELIVYDWSNGVVMISVFALVCIILIAVLVNFMTSGKNKTKDQD